MMSLRRLQHLSSMPNDSCGEIHFSLLEGTSGPPAAVALSAMDTSANQKQNSFHKYKQTPSTNKLIQYT